MSVLPYLMARRRALLSTGGVIIPETSYDNPGGKGERRPGFGTHVVTVTSNQSVSGIVQDLVDGLINNAFFFPGATTTGWRIQFDFGVGKSKLIDEFKWYQSNTAAHGTWKMQGSNDTTAWTDIGSSFTLGGATVKTQSIAPNETGYRYYRLFQVSGNTSSSPWVFETEFKIADMN